MRVRPCLQGAHSPVGERKREVDTQLPTVKGDWCKKRKSSLMVGGGLRGESDSLWGALEVYN